MRPGGFTSSDGIELTDRVSVVISGVPWSRLESRVPESSEKNSAEDMIGVWLEVDVVNGVRHPVEEGLFSSTRTGFKTLNLVDGPCTHGSDTPFSMASIVDLVPIYASTVTQAYTPEDQYVKR